MERTIFIFLFFFVGCTKVTDFDKFTIKDASADARMDARPDSSFDAGARDSGLLKADGGDAGDSGLLKADGGDSGKDAGCVGMCVYPCGPTTSGPGYISCGGEKTCCGNSGRCDEREGCM